MYINLVLFEAPFRTGTLLYCMYFIKVLFGSYYVFTVFWRKKKTYDLISTLLRSKQTRNIFEWVFKILDSNFTTLRLLNNSS